MKSFDLAPNSVKDRGDPKLGPPYPGYSMFALIGYEQQAARDKNIETPKRKRRR